MKAFVSTLLFIALLAATVLGYSHLRPWPHMFLLVTCMFVFFKWISLVYYQGEEKIRYPLTYLLAWVGMDPKPFSNKKPNLPNPISTLMEGLTCLFLGAVLIYLAIILQVHWYLRAWLGCLAIVFAFHFGLFKLQVYFLRGRGFDVEPIMQFPLGASRISDFWAGRWNRAFNQLVYPFVYFPLKDRLGQNRAVLGTFLFSGIVHEWVISIPARSGYGLPTLYFMLQAVGLLMERKWIQSRIFTIIIVALPAVILFHPPFMRQVMLELILEMRSLWISI